MYVSARPEIFTLVFHTSKKYEIVALEKGSWSYYFLYAFSSLCPKPSFKIKTIYIFVLIVYIYMVLITHWFNYIYKKEKER